MDGKIMDLSWNGWLLLNPYFFVWSEKQQKQQSVEFFSDHCLLSEAFALHGHISAPRGQEMLDHRVPGCVWLPRAWCLQGVQIKVLPCSTFQALNQVISVSWQIYVCSETICSFSSVAKGTLAQAVRAPGWIPRFVILSPATWWRAVLITDVLSRCQPCQEESHVSWAVALMQNQACWAQAVPSGRIVRLKITVNE